MKTYLKITLTLLSFSLVLTACNKKEWDEYYGRPDGLGDPIYQQLQAKGNFTHILALVDKAGYKEILSTQGWWTFFAPNDAAFDLFYKEQNLDDSKVTDSLARSIVKYSLLFNGYRKDQLSTFQSGANNEAGAGLAFKRRTAYYDWVQKATSGSKQIIATNRNATYRRTNSLTTTVVNVSMYVDGDNNFKYIPYFTDDYFAGNGLGAADYQTFYPGSTYTGFNVASANVIEKDLAAENGVIHILDKVILPLKSLDQYLSSGAEYSEFKKLLDSLSFLTPNAYLTNRNAVQSGSLDSVYAKAYNGQLAFSPNNESYQVPGSIAFAATNSQRNSWTLLAPNNNAMNEYRRKLLAKYKNSFSNAPASLLIDFINSHMWADAVWPSTFQTKTNYQDEAATVTLDNAVDKKVLSNGIFYGLNKAHNANVFRSLYGIPYLDPAYYMTFMGYQDPSTAIKETLIQPNVKYAVFIMPDAVLSAAGWRYNEGSAGTSATPWGYKSATASSYSHSATYRDIIQRMLKTGIALSPNGEFDDLSGEGMIESFNGEYIKYKNNKIQTSGNVDAGTWLNITSTDRSAINGPAYIVDGLLSYSEKNVGQHIENLAATYPDSYGSFYWFLKSSNVYNANSKAITGINSGPDYNYTVFVPTNQAITEAIKAGLLPGNVNTGALPAAAPTSSKDMDLVRKFILYHIINGATVVPDGKKSDNYLTLLQTESGDNTMMEVTNIKNNMVITDRRGRQASVVMGTSNQLSSRTVIHSLNTYLNYNQ